MSHIFGPKKETCASVVLFIIVNKRRASLMKPIYFPVICGVVAHPNQDTITKLIIKKDFHWYTSFG